MAILTIAMLLALQDAPQVHEDPKPRTGAMTRRVATAAPSSLHQPRRPRSPAVAAQRPSRAVLPVNGPPGDDRPLQGKPANGPGPANGPPRGRPARPAPPVALAPSVAVPARRPVMQPMPAPPAPPGRAPTPRGSPQTWITNDDYPAPALRAAMSGPVAFRLDVDATGMPVRCTVTLSSGYDLLDNTTCSLMMRRARFNPAMGSGGRAIAGAWTSRMRWALPAGNPGSGSAEPGTWTRTLRFTIAADGAISNCLEELGRTRVERPSGGCAALAYSDPEATKEWRGSARGPVTIVIRQTQIEVGTPGLTPAALPDGLKTVMSQRASFEIGDAGLPVACSGVIDVLVLPVRALGCWPGMRYPRSSARQSVIVTQVVLTTGDERVGAAMKVTEN